MIRSTLLRLGLQATAAQVVEALAHFGIEVSQGLVHRVKLEMLKNTAEFIRTMGRAPSLNRLVHRPQKVPQRRR